MATAEEMDTLNWFLAKHPELFPRVQAVSGTQEEDWAGIDAWLVRDGKPFTSLGVRNHADEVTERQFTIRFQRGTVPAKKFEYAKLVAGGGPRFYLQAWGNTAIDKAEFVFASVRQMRTAGCFDPAQKANLWEDYLFKKDQTKWLQMTVAKLHSLPNCVIISDVYSRGSFANPLLDKDICGTERLHFFVRPKKKQPIGDDA